MGAMTSLQGVQAEGRGEGSGEGEPSGSLSVYVVYW